MYDDARAILVAIRPVSDAMRRAAAKRLAEMNKIDDPESDAVVAWTAIIDHAIEE
jgi:hypothetical protein